MARAIGNSHRSCASCGSPLSRYNLDQVCRRCTAPVIRGAGASASSGVGGACPLCRCEVTGAAAAAVAERSAGIGPRLAAARRAHGLTQPMLADLANVSFSLLSKLETGHRPPTLASLTAVCRVLGVPVATLVEDGRS